MGPNFSEVPYNFSDKAPNFSNNGYQSPSPYPNTSLLGLKRLDKGMALHKLKQTNWTLRSNSSVSFIQGLTVGFPYIPSGG